MNTAVIVGYGQLGHSVCKRHLEHNDQVLTFARSPQTPQGSNHKHLILDLDAGELSLTDFPLSIDVLYYFAPPDDENLQDNRLRSFLAQSQATISHIIYISTSGVYGSSNGNWITENTPAAPQADRGHRRLDAEKQLICFQQQTGTSVTILRCAAIYSSQTVNRDRIAKNTRPVIKLEQAPYTNRIHIDDLTAVCWQAMRHPPEGVEIYNVSDGQPSTTTEHGFLLADLAGVERPRQIDLSEADQYYSPAYMSYLNESKRLDTTKLMKQLKPVLRYSDIQAGINNCLALSKHGR